MRKVAQITALAVSFLAMAPKALAETIKIKTELPTQFVNAGSVKIGNIPQFIITLLLVTGIIIAIIFLIYGGIKWILSGGDSKQVEGARNHIVAAIVGLVIVVAAFVILNIVFTILTGNSFSLSNICIPTLVDGSCTGAVNPLDATPIPTNGN